MRFAWIVEHWNLRYDPIGCSLIGRLHRIAVVPCLMCSTRVRGQTVALTFLASVKRTASSAERTASQWRACSVVVIAGRMFFEAIIDLRAVRSLTTESRRRMS